MPSATPSSHSEGQSRKSVEIEVGDKANGHPSTQPLKTRFANGKKRRTTPGTGNSSRSRPTRRQLRRKTRSWIYFILLPFFYLAFVLLHCIFWLGSSISRSSAIIRRRRHIPRWADEIERKLCDLGTASMSEGCKDQKIRVPRHLALLIPSTPPSSSLLILHLVCRFFQRLFFIISNLFSAPTHSHQKSPTTTTTTREIWRQHTLSDTLDRFECLQAVLRHAALVRIPVVSLWDDDTDGAGSLWDLIERDHRFARKNQTWSLRMDNTSSSIGQQFSPPEMLRVDVWNSQRRLKCSTSSETKANGIEQHRDDSILTIKLEILSPESDGRDAFASISRSIAAKMLRQASHTDMDRESIKTSGSISLKESVDKITVSDIDRALAENNYSTSEPDLLLAISASPPARSLGDYPRWPVRITEVCHTCVNAQSYTVLDFWAALMQFTRAEQRYGR